MQPGLAPVLNFAIRRGERIGPSGRNQAEDYVGMMVVALHRGENDGRPSLGEMSAGKGSNDDIARVQLAPGADSSKFRRDAAVASCRSSSVQ